MEIESTIELEGSHDCDYLAVNFTAEVAIYPGEDEVIDALPEDCYPGYPDDAEVIDSKISEIFDWAGTQYKQVGGFVVGSPVPDRYLNRELSGLEEVALTEYDGDYSR